MAEALMRQRAAFAGSGVEVESAGFETHGETPPVETIRAMERRGIDISGHRSRTVSPAELAEADLVVGMTRAHVWNAALLEPTVVPRAYVFGELIRLNRLISNRQPRETFADWVGRLHSGRQHELTRIAPDQEVPDPYGRRARVHERVAQQLEQLILEAGDCAFDPSVSDHDLRWREGKLIWHP